MMGDSGYMYVAKDGVAKSGLINGIVGECRCASLNSLWLIAGGPDFVGACGFLEEKVSLGVTVRRVTHGHLYMAISNHGGLVPVGKCKCRVAAVKFSAALYRTR